MVKQQPFHFTLGPVQGFVVQARRTRDLWVGSYLLSYLSGIGMRAIIGSGGKIVFPAVEDDPLFQALVAERKPIEEGDLAARVGSLPNRFKAEADDAVEAAKNATSCINDAWEGIADKAWTRLKQKSGLVTSETKKIWDRQIKNQWEIAWVVGNEGSLLDQRKNIRSHFQEDEPGEKCTLCGERQALSQGLDDRRVKVREFWSQVARNFNGESGFHFLEDGKERLCSICTTKRIFPLVAEEAIGWKVYRNYPSTAYMCAVDWLKSVLSRASEDNQVAVALEEYIKVADDARIPHDEDATKMPGITKLLGDDKKWAAITRLRGDAFFVDSIKNQIDFSIMGNSEKDIENKRKKLLASLESLTKAVDIAPTPFYAMLLMDGDNMGKTLADLPGEQGNISRALAMFTSGVPSVVEEEHDGKLLYAGGDDVFAMLPLDMALACASKLRDLYLHSFSKHAPNVPSTTISAGIIYAHMNTALRAVVKDSHILLDKIAKAEMDRDSLAVRVWKRGGPVLTFAKKQPEKEWLDEIINLKESFSINKEFASGLFYRIRDILPILETLDEEQQIQLMTAEYLKSRELLGLPEDFDKRREKAEERVKRLISLFHQKGKLSADGPLFIRFLSQKEA